MLLYVLTKIFWTKPTRFFFKWYYDYIKLLLDGGGEVYALFFNTILFLRLLWIGWLMIDDISDRY